MQIQHVLKYAEYYGFDEVVEAYRYPGCVAGIMLRDTPDGGIFRFVILSLDSGDELMKFDHGDPAIISSVSEELQAILAIIPQHALPVREFRNLQRQFETQLK